MKKLFLFLGLVTGMGIVAAYFLMIPSAQMAYRPLQIKGIIGSEKQGFFENPQLKKLLKSRYNLIVDYSKAGSIDMVTQQPPQGIDFLFPSSQVAGELYKTRHDPTARVETIFNSPIVIYSWDIVTEALQEQSIVQLRDNNYYIVDYPRLITLVQSRAKWADIGLDALYGQVMLYPTDPTKSNSGFQFAGLLANMLSGGEVVTRRTLASVTDQIRNFFARIGYMEHSTGYLFEQFLTTGVGNKPMVVGYENQIIEFCLANVAMCSAIQGRVFALYPEPTVWSSHVLIPLSSGGERLMHALLDPEIQTLAWEQHGFRSGMIGVQNNPKAFNVQHIPNDIVKVIPMPSAEVMDTIVRSLEQM